MKELKQKKAKPSVYKIHARKQISLRFGIEQLKLGIRQLENSTNEFKQLVQCVKVEAGRARLDIVKQLYTLFEFGMGNIPKQFDFMNANIKNEVTFNGGKCGKQVFWNQMMMLTTLYTKLQFELIKIDFCGLTYEIMHVVAKVHLQVDRKVIVTLYPNLNKQYKMAQLLIGKWMTVNVNQVYYFDGRFIQSINTNCDWITAWRKLCPNYQDVNTIMKNANIDQHLFIRF